MEVREWVGKGAFHAEGTAGVDSEAVACVPRGQRGYCRQERVRMRSENGERPGGEGRGDPCVCSIILFRVR